MRKSHLTALGAVAILALGAACSSGNGSGSGAGMSSTGGTSTGGNMGSCPDNLASPDGSDFCTADATPVDCYLVTGVHHFQICGVPEQQPMKELARSSGVKEFGGSGP